MYLIFDELHSSLVHKDIPPGGTLPNQCVFVFFKHKKKPPLYKVKLFLMGAGDVGTGLSQRPLPEQLLWKRHQGIPGWVPCKDSISDLLSFQDYIFLFDGQPYNLNLQMKVKLSLFWIVHDQS